MSPSRLFILRPVATVLLMVAIVLCGAVAYKQLPVCAAAGRLSDHSGRHLLPGSQSRGDGVVCDGAFGAAVRAGARPGPDDFDELGRQLGDRVAVRPGAQHRRRRAAGAGGDQRGGHLSAGRSAQPSDLQQDESGRCADSHAGPQFRHAAPVEDRGPGRYAVRAKDRANGGRGAGEHFGGTKAGDSRAVESDGAFVSRPEPGRRPQRDRRGQRQPGEGELRRQEAGLHDRRQRPDADGQGISEPRGRVPADRSRDPLRRRVGG